MDVETENTGLSPYLTELFSFLHYIDAWYTTDEGVHCSLTAYSYKALTTENFGYV